MAFLHGAALVTGRGETASRTPRPSSNHLDKQNVNTWFSVPSLLVYFFEPTDFGPRELAANEAHAIFGGEGLSKIVLQRIARCAWLAGFSCSMFMVPLSAPVSVPATGVSERDFHGREAMRKLWPRWEILPRISRAPDSRREQSSQ